MSNKPILNSKIQGNKNKTLSVIALALLISGLFAVTIPTAHAAALLTAKQYAFANPDPVGVGQTIVIGGWITPPPVYGGTDPSKFIYWTGIYIKITNPSGVITSFGPITVDPAASYWMNYAPTMVGDYTVAQSWDGNATSIGAPAAAQAQAFTYAPTSATTKFTVQQQQITPWAQTPLPTGFWQRPINGMNRDWNILAGSWLFEQGASRGGYDQSVSCYQPYSLAPNTPHVNWVIPSTIGGQIGGQGTQESSGSGAGTILNSPGPLISSAMYESQMDMIIISGNGYYADGWTVTYGATGGSQYTGVTQSPSATTRVDFTLHCVDIHTGKERWAKPEYTFGGPLPSGAAGQTGGMLQGQIEPSPTASSSGSIGPQAYILALGTTFVRIDAATGTEMFVMNNSLSGAFDGSQYVYSKSGSRLIKWDINGLATDVNNTIASVVIYNVTAPSVTYGGTTTYLSPSMPSNGIGIASYTVPYANGLAPGIAGINLTTGQLMWNNTLWGLEGGEGTGCQAGGKYFYLAGDASWHCFNSNTGQQMWVSEPAVLPWGKFWGYSAASDGNYFYGMCYDGYVYCYNANTGATVWKYFSGSSGLNTPYNAYPFFSPPVLADGKLYVANSEHSPTNPEWEGANMFCLNATTGNLIWKLPWFGGYKAVADGMLVAFNQYDCQLYCFGKGLTATTVSAPNVAVPQGTAVLLQGTVTDQSPANTCLGIPAAGTPAVSDDSMSTWMQYLYMQQPKPTNATGVQVHVTAIDPNGNYQDIGYVTSDIDGTFACAWTPPVQGVYKVTVTFAGSNSYYTSTGTTHFLLGPAPSSVSASIAPSPTPTQTAAPTSAPTQTPTSPSPSIAPQPTSAMPTTTYIAIAAAVVIIAVLAAAIILRRRK